MLFHRWGTISQIISTTKLPLCNLTPEDKSDEGNLERDAVALVHALSVKRPKRSEEPSSRKKGPAGRRQTVAKLISQNVEKSAAQPLNLEKVVRDRLQSISVDEMQASTNSALRRMSTRS